MPLRVGHVVIYQTQHVVIHSLSVRLHVLPYLAEHLLKTLLHLIRRVVVLLVNLLSVRGSSRQLVLLVKDLTLELLHKGCSIHVLIQSLHISDALISKVSIKKN